MRYESEDRLVEKMQSGQYGWKEYIEHHSRELRAEYEAYCQRKGMDATEEASATEFMEMREREFDEAVKEGNA
jgi:hypothetical protein